MLGLKTLHYSWVIEVYGFDVGRHGVQAHGFFEEGLLSLRGSVPDIDGGDRVRQPRVGESWRFEDDFFDLMVWAPRSGVRVRSRRTARTDHRRRVSARRLLLGIDEKPQIQALVRTDRIRPRQWCDSPSCDLSAAVAQSTGRTPTTTGFSPTTPWHFQRGWGAPGTSPASRAIPARAPRPQRRETVIAASRCRPSSEAHHRRGERGDARLVQLR